MVSIKRILCPVDLSDCSRLALAHAAALTSWYEASLTVLHVFADVPVFGVPPAPRAPAMPPVTLKETDRDALFEGLQRFVAPYTDGRAVDIELREAPDPRHEILGHAATLGADLLIMGTHGRSGFDHLLLGSVTEKVMRKSPRPVMVVPRHASEPPAPSSPPFRRILCAIDFSAGSLRALSYALDLAQESDARISLLHVLEMPPELGEFPFARDFNINGLQAAAEAKYVERLCALVPAEARTYCTVTTQVSEGRAQREILRVAAEERSELIVMGVQGRGALDLMLFGSNTHAVIRGSTCPVLAIPAEAAMGASQAA